jgi:hypothetical protein
MNMEARDLITLGSWPGGALVEHGVDLILS